MSRFRWALLLVFLLVAPALSIAPAAAQASRSAPVRIRLLNRMGNVTTLTIDENTEVLVFASWCPVSRRLNEILRDPKVRPYLRRKKLVYVFEYRELERSLAPRVRSGEITQAALDEYSRRLPPGPHLSDPDFLSRLAARDVYFADERHPIEYSGYPSAFSGPPNVFELDYRVWMSRDLGLPADLKDALFKAHPSGGGE